MIQKFLFHLASNSKHCWICFATEEDDQNAIWTQPCNCRGTTKWVHQACLQQWVDEKQKDSRDKKVACPQCKTEYLIYFPKANSLVVILDRADALIYRMCPFIAAGILVGSLYWTAVTYGAVTVMQVAGQAEATQLMERMEPAVLLTALPTIPISLIVLKMFHWEDSLLLFLRKTSPSLPILNYLLPAPVRNESGAITENPVTDGMSCTRVFTGALLLPTIATICGNTFFQHIQSGLQRSIVGGIAFIAVKGIIKMYHKQQVYKRLSKRKILDYTEENIRRTQGGPNSGRSQPSMGNLVATSAGGGVTSGPPPGNQASVPGLDNTASQQ
ncbi:E3 ubiquitin-protein ligase MARCH5-like isoform X2 [Cimex lectularius]|uniref:E3 ubiquitin-protein ligase MARCHF5 n=1 Tax=Cimex lectularius TaxID=79782 RepID=A0A8I6S7N5_CIMLE|nr:E3 ubiquitin-protein ligase MARCH5-like isoform X2 [Cimex lectularius]